MGKKPNTVCKEEIYQKIYEELSPDLYKFLYYKYGADNNPDDLVQEAFIKLWDKCKEVPPEKAKSFLFTVARNKMLNELDKKKTVLKYRYSAELKVHDHESPEYKMEEDQFGLKLQAALSELSEAQRVAFLMNRIEGKKHQEIAEILGISRKAVEKRIYGALNYLKKKIDY